jgi:VWFA-related protein
LALLRLTRNTPHFGLILASLTLTGISVAQEPTPSNQAPAIKVQVNQVLAPVIVTDRKGHFVTDLTAGDFQVFEDGVEQKLVAVSTEKNGASELFPPEAGPAPGTGGSMALSTPAGNTPVSRTYLIVLDTLNSSFGDFVQVRDALKKLFKQEESADSQYALITLGRPMRVIQNLTRDPDAILTAIGSKDFSKSIMTSEHSNLAQQESELMDILEHCPPPPPAASGAQEPCPSAENFANMAARERDMITRNLIADLRSLTEQLSRMPGRRAMILASDGFNLQPGRELFELIAAYDNDPSVLLHNQTSYLLDDMSPIVRLATARNVTFYTLDSRGVYTTPAGGFDSSQRAAVDPKAAVTVLPAMQSAKETSAWENQDAMSYLAEATGGVFYHGNNDLLRGFRQAFADGRQYYVLAYDSSHRVADGKYRAIKVQLKGKNLIVRAKPGYWAPMASATTTAAAAHAEPTTLAALAPAGNIPPIAPAPPAKPTVVMPVLPEDLSRVTLTPPSEPLTSAAPPSFVDMPISELVRELPELKKLRPTTSQELLPSILQKVGANVAILFERFPNVTSREQVTEQRLNGVGGVDSQIYQTFRYLAVGSPDKKDVGFEEYRTDTKGNPVEQRGLNQYLITKGFVSIPFLFHPLYQPDSRYRYLGQEVVGKRNTEVVAFAQKSTARVRELFSINGKSGGILAQGIAWIDPDNYQIVRMQVDLRAPVLEIGLRSQTTRVTFTEVHFKGESSALWLPRKVEVETRLSDADFRNTHFYSEFKEFTVQTQERTAAPATQ